MKTFQHFTTEAYNRRSHRGTDYHGRDYGGTPEDHENAMRRNKKQQVAESTVSFKDFRKKIYEQIIINEQIEKSKE